MRPFGSGHSWAGKVLRCRIFRSLGYLRTDQRRIRYVYLGSVEVRTSFICRASGEIDASDVFQPVNPGDGLIRKYNWIGLAPEPRRYIQLDGLKLTAESNPAQGPSSVVVEILNTGISVVRVSTAEIGINVFGIKREGTADVSDGRSEAVITRAHLQRSLGQFLDTNENGSRFHASFEADNSIPDTIRLEPGAAYRVIIKFDLSPGEYQFVFGYGGGVHEERALLSNGVSFDVTSEAARALDTGRNSPISPSA